MSWEEQYPPILKHETRTFAACLEDRFDASAGGAYVYTEVF